MCTSLNNCFSKAAFLEVGAMLWYAWSDVSLSSRRVCLSCDIVKNQYRVDNPEKYKAANLAYSRLVRERLGALLRIYTSKVEDPGPGRCCYRAVPQMQAPALFTAGTDLHSSAFEAISNTLSESPLVSTMCVSSFFIIACLSLSSCRQLVKHDTNLEATWLLILSTCNMQQTIQPDCPCVCT